MDNWTKKKTTTEKKRLQKKIKNHKKNDEINEKILRDKFQKPEHTEWFHKHKHKTKFYGLSIMDIIIIII